MSECKGCGLCCLHMSLPPYDEEEREYLRKHVPDVYADLLAVEETRRFQLAVVGTDFIPCGFLDPVTRTCRHHENNPDVCQIFEAGGEFCNQSRRDAGLNPLELQEVGHDHDGT